MAAGGASAGSFGWPGTSCGAPISVWTSRVRSGDALAKKGFLVTPAQDGVSVNPAVLNTPRSPLRAVAGGVLAPVVAPAMVPARAPEL